MESDLSFSHQNARKGFSDYIRYAICHVEANQLVESGPSDKKNWNSDSRFKNDVNKNRFRIQVNKNATKKDNKGGKSDDIPVCLLSPYAERVIRHSFKDFETAPDENKKQIFQERAAEKSKYRRSKLNRSLICDTSSSSDRSSTGTVQLKDQHHHDNEIISILPYHNIRR